MEWQQGLAANLEESFPKNGVFSCEQAAGYVRVGYLQEMEFWGQGQADAFLRQQSPASRNCH